VFDPNHVVMPGLVPGIHALLCCKDVDGRDKPGHDGKIALLGFRVDKLRAAVGKNQSISIT